MKQRKKRKGSYMEGEGVEGGEGLELGDLRHVHNPVPVHVQDFEVRELGKDLEGKAVIFNLVDRSRSLPLPTTHLRLRPAC